MQAKKDLARRIVADFHSRMRSGGESGGLDRLVVAVIEP
jgi:hypothetical protein